MNSIALRSSLLLILILGLAGCSQGLVINSQLLQMEPVDGSDRFVEDLLVGEIPEIDVRHIALSGPYMEQVETDSSYDDIYLFIKGFGELQSSDSLYKVVPESIALPFFEEGVTIRVPAGETLHFVHIRKGISPADREQMASFPQENRARIYFKRFTDCEAYTEPIKSPNTVSRTVLPKDHIARVAMGTVQAPGPDAVGAHVHGMLEQHFFGLAGNRITVFADGAERDLLEFELLHIPRGSSHGVRVADGNQMYYMWMDFFQTKEGEEWLKTHKAVEDDY